MSLCLVQDGAYRREIEGGVSPLFTNTVQVVLRAAIDFPTVNFRFTTMVLSSTRTAPLASERKARLEGNT